MKFRSVENPKSAQLLIRLTPEEKREATEKAADCGMSVSEFVLRAIQGRQTRAKHGPRLIGELRMIGMALKDIYAAEKPRDAVELEPVMKAIIVAIDRIATESRINL